MHILIVEDNPDVLSSLEDLLVFEGYKVLLATHGLEALEILSKISLLPSLIILDIMMPVMDGPTFFRELKATEKYQDIPVLIFSAVQDRTKLLGADGYLKKPADVADILKFVAKYLPGVSVP